MVRLVVWIEGAPSGSPPVKSSMDKPSGSGLSGPPAASGGWAQSALGTCHRQSWILTLTSVKVEGLHRIFRHRSAEVQTCFSLDIAKVWAMEALRSVV